MDGHERERSETHDHAEWRPLDNAWISA